ncbi:MAG TPA: hypothetical protein PLZ15_09885 [Melioribacteraceae bacterium]|mgnify:CR=1 FL=1|nr:hypothetical protein [Melioribacteraceae bacterium]
MKPVTFLLSAVILLFTISCAPSRFYIDQNFKDIEPNSTLIITNVNEIDISQSYDLFTLENLRVLRNSYYDIQKVRLPRELKEISRFDKIETTSYKTPPQFEKRVFQINPKETVEVMVPKSRLNYDLGGLLYVLFFENYKIAFELEETDTSDPAKHFTAEKLPGLEPSLSPSRLYKLNFTIRCKYYFYDNRNEKVLLAGNAVIKERYSPEMNLENKMLESIKLLAQRLIDKTPFAK